MIYMFYFPLIELLFFFTDYILGICYVSDTALSWKFSNKPNKSLLLIKIVVGGQGKINI